MRIEEQAVYDRIARIKSAGRTFGARLFILIGKMEEDQHFAMRPMDEDWELAETAVEAAVTSKHFTEKHGDDMEAYTLFHAAAKAEFFGVFDARENNRAVTRAEENYHEVHWTGRLGDLADADREAADDLVREDA